MKVIKIKSAEELAKVMKIREIVFINEQEVPIDEEVDGLDTLNNHNVIHFGLYDSLELAGTVRLVNEEKYIKICRVCLLKQYRGQNLGKFMLNEVINSIVLGKTFNTKNKYLYLEAQKYAVEFYEKLGFVPFGFVELSDDFKLIKMKKNI